MARFYLVFGFIVVSAFTWAQYKGMGLFDETSNVSQTRLSPSARSTFHK